MIWIVFWLLACFVTVLALTVRAMWRDIAEIRIELAEKEDDLK